VVDSVSLWCCVQMSLPHPTVMSGSALRERRSPSPASDVFQPPSATLSSPAPPSTTIIEPTPTKDTDKLDDLETELELDLENMKLDNIDTTVSLTVAGLIPVVMSHARTHACTHTHTREVNHSGF